MRILVACEFSGVVREAFRAEGHEAWSCDLLPSEIPGHHLQGDVLQQLDRGWDLLIAFPPCTYLCSSGMHWTTRGLRDPQHTLDAMAFVRRLWEAQIPRICLENPIGILSTRLTKPSQIIQPHQFGHDASKSTCLWLKNLPLLTPTQHVPPRLVVKQGKTMLRWANQTDSGQNVLGPSADRWALRSITYPGIARAMATQWK